MEKKIPEYEMYTIDYDGNVWSKYKNRFLSPQKDIGGYMVVNLSKNGKLHHFLIHRLVALTFLPNFYNKPTVDHINRNRSDNRLYNLRWATMSEQNYNTGLRKDNMFGLKHIGFYKKKNCYRIRIVRNGKYLVNKSYSMYKYTLEQVLDIRNEFYKQYNISL